MLRLISAGFSIIVIGIYASYALLRPLPPLQPIVSSLPNYPAQAAQLNWPSYGSGAIGAAGYDILETHGSDTPVPTASTIKVLTALVVLNQHPLQVGEQGPLITITQTDIASYNKYLALDGSVVRVELGEKLSEYQALQAMLIPSANNMAETLARWTFGSLDAFNRYASEYAIKVGLNETTITDPSGFQPTTVSSPSDLVRLGLLALNNPVITQIVGQATATIPVAGVVHNYNTLLGVAGVFGIKTGNNDQNGGCLLFATKQTVDSEPVTVVGVLAGGPNLWATLHDSLSLIRSLQANFVRLRAISRSQHVVTYHIPWAGTVYGIPARGVDLTAWRNSTTSAQVIASKEHAGTAQSTVIGRLTVHNSKIGSDTVASVILSAKIPEPSVWWRLTHPF